jgi:hypothetical protein
VGEKLGHPQPTPFLYIWPVRLTEGLGPDSLLSLRVSGLRGSKDFLLLFSWAFGDLGPHLAWE